MNPFDETDLGTKFLYGIGAPIAGLIVNIVPAEINPWLQRSSFQLSPLFQY
jgi:hypothetical protein